MRSHPQHRTSNTPSQLHKSAKQHRPTATKTNHHRLRQRPERLPRSLRRPPLNEHKCITVPPSALAAGLANKRGLGSQSGTVPRHRPAAAAPRAVGPRCRSRRPLALLCRAALLWAAALTWQRPAEPAVNATIAKSSQSAFASGRALRQAVSLQRVDSLAVRRPHRLRPQ